MGYFGFKCGKVDVEYYYNEQEQNCDCVDVYDYQQYCDEFCVQ